MSLRGGRGITHLHYSGPTLWRFGSGGSYTSFGLSMPASAPWATDVDAGALAAARAPALNHTLTVRNTGAVAGGFVAMGFVTAGQGEGGEGGEGGAASSSRRSGVPGFPRQRLFAFSGTPAALAPGESASLQLAAPTAAQLGVADQDGRMWLHPGRYTLHFGGPPGSQNEAVLRHVLTVHGEQRVALPR